MRHRLLVVRAIGRQIARAAASASPIPATLPWPKIAQTPANKGTAALELGGLRGEVSHQCLRHRQPDRRHGCPALQA